MAKQTGNITNFALGIADSNKMGEAGQCRFTRGFDFRSDPAQMTVLPKAILASGTAVRDLPLWSERVGSTNYFYGDAGRIYKLESGVFEQEHQAANSRGNGLAYLGEDRHLYYAQNTTIGRLGPIDNIGSPSYVDNYLGAIGGEPTNTRSLVLERASSQAAYITNGDQTGLNITGNLTLSAYAKMDNLPTTGEIQTLVSKWNQDGNQRGYSFEIVPTSASFGNGSDGNLTISSNTTETVIDANFSANAGVTSLTVSNVTGTFAAGQKVLLHQTRGSNAGRYEFREILTVSGSTITLTEPISNTYAHSTTASVANKAQIRVVKQYNNVTINSGVTWTAKAWDGLKGGILAFYCLGTLTRNGSISATGRGFRGGRAGYLSPGSYPHSGATGESQTSASIDGQALSAWEGVPSAPNPPQGGGGGGGRGRRGPDGGTGGGGASYGSGGSAGVDAPSLTAGAAGSTYGNSNITAAHLGSGGGGAGKGKDGSSTLYGGNGGGAIIVLAKTINGSGAIRSNGNNGDNGFKHRGGSGGGSGGSILISSQEVAVGTMTATGGSGGGPGEDSTYDTPGGNGGNGRIAIYYSTSISGSSTPSASSILDPTLSAISGHQLQLRLSSNGTNEEVYFIDITNTNKSFWNRYSVVWQASTSTANFYINGEPSGEMTRTLTSIHNSTSNFAIGCSYNNTAQNFFDGQIDDVRVYNQIITASQMLTRNNKVLTGEEFGLQGYWELESDLDDTTSNENDLTALNAPTYSEDVPFWGLSFRKDQDQGQDESGQTYAIPTSIDEGATHRLTFVPQKDPQRSVILNIGAVGTTADWTLTIHDTLNRAVAQKTIPNEELVVGFNEFIFDEPWRPIRGALYHLHITVDDTTGTPTVVTGTTSDLETAYFSTHFNILVNDKYHPMARFLNKVLVGNERYVATLEAVDIYDPHTLVLPSGHRVRSFAFWREFVAIGTVRGESITDFDSGRIFFWDGISDEINFYIDVPEGGINAMLSARGNLFFIAGYSGDLMLYQGGDMAFKIKRMPGFERGDVFEVAPGSMNMWKSLLMFGTGESTSSTIERGVYSWGALNQRILESMNMEHPTSLGVQKDSDTVIGTVTASGANLYIGWQSGTTYGIDVVEASNDPYQQEATYETLITDSGSTSKKTLPTIYRVDFKPLREGESVTIKFRKNREDNFITLKTEETVGARFVRAGISVESNEFEFAFDVKCEQTSPTIIGHGIEQNDARYAKSI